eukprot:CAMPEP_0201281104 /NCGR_PEP_ID=MMETSP1317-20130820/1416_1 /ASSEMBLY_ACC=CAM_ASM_000770 /TAXON_ID=187299 /ORGANISM="Undescribed Undescribed, Strain Undescribed" /LENGTH=51 /DNA_ID=CAMNT_0047590095 /DNA_START=959 /DNA_END=1114 /DNA_ORIENTATION=+
MVDTMVQILESIYSALLAENVNEGTLELVAELQASILATVDKNSETGLNTA